MFISSNRVLVYIRAMEKMTIEVAVLRWKGLEKIYKRTVVTKYNILQIKSNHRLFRFWRYGNVF